MNFSILISVYHKESPTFLEEALNSLEQQALLPNEIILVKDGPLTPELDHVILLHLKSTIVPYKIVTLVENVGLGIALNEGLQACQYEWVARMDGDDIAYKERFQKQISYLKQHPKVDVLGSWISEFSIDPKQPDNHRKPPENHTDILKYATYTSPVNHMSVMYKKSAVLAAGSYQNVNTLEDYHLWIRMIVQGSVFANIPEVLINARTGENMLMRRHGWKYFYNELKIAQDAYNLGFLSRWEQFRNFFYRALPRLMPLFILKRLYNFARNFSR